MRRASRNTTQIDRSLQMNAEAIRLAQEQVALQTETNRLLRQLVEARGQKKAPRFSGRAWDSWPITSLSWPDSSDGPHA